MSMDARRGRLTSRQPSAVALTARLGSPKVFRHLASTWPSPGEGPVNGSRCGTASSS